MTALLVILAGLALMAAVMDLDYRARRRRTVRAARLALINAYTREAT